MAAHWPSDGVPPAAVKVDRLVSAPNMSAQSTSSAAVGIRGSRPRHSSAQPAPMIPIRPQPTICHGVHGPWPKTRLEDNAASAPTAKPGAPPSTKPVRKTMSVVGLTLGSGAKAIRPSAASAASVATMANTLLDGCVRSYQAKPSASTSASSVKVVSCQVIARRLPSCWCRSAAPAAGSSARPPVTRAVSVAKYQPPARTAPTGPSAIGRPSASRMTRSATSAANSGSWVATTIAAPPAAKPASRSVSAALAARSMPRVGSSRPMTAAGSSESRTIASASRWRWPPERSRGWRSSSWSRPTAASAPSEASSPTRSCSR